MIQFLKVKYHLMLAFSFYFHANVIKLSLLILNYLLSFTSQYPDLLKHFSDSHYLCMEGECGNPNTRFTHAFVSDIDLKAHKAQEHNKNLSKAQVREARHINVDFQLAPRRTAHGSRGGKVTSFVFSQPAH